MLRQVNLCELEFSKQREIQESHSYLIEKSCCKEKEKKKKERKKNNKLQKEASNGLGTELTVCLEFMNHAAEMIQAVMAGHWVL